MTAFLYQAGFLTGINTTFRICFYSFIVGRGKAMDRINCGRTIEKPKFILSTSGVWPTAKTTIPTIFSIVFNLCFETMVLTIVTFNILDAIKYKQINLLNKMICIAIAVINYIAKTGTLTINKKCFLSIIEDLESDVFNGHSRKLNNHIHNIYNNCNLVFRYFAVVLVMYSLIGSILPMIVDIPLTIPVSFYRGKYQFQYKIFHFFFTALLSYNTIGLDILCLTLISVSIAQMDILQERLINVLEDCKETCGNKYFLNLEVERNLRECVILHKKIIE